MSAAVRIYVLHHPESEAGQMKDGRISMVDRIYNWFRLPEQRHRGIPVYVRVRPEQMENSEDMLCKKPVRCLNYLVPLVDELMVRDSVWHDYLEQVAKKAESTRNVDQKGWVVMPVALHPTAFNLPAAVAARNFIRLPEGEPEAAAESCLADLTEALARDLNGRLFPKKKGQPLKIFISYARADKPDVPRQIRDYILGNTQCEAFLDENDIGFGFKFTKVLKQATKDQARAFIVVAGDHYADRPICRWEISQFTQPDPLRLGVGKTAKNIHVFHPMMVVSTMTGSRPTRVLPELGGVPSIQWQTGQARLCFSLLMRDLMLGLRNVLEARSLKKAGKLLDGLVLNRMPGPVILQKLLNSPAVANIKVSHIHYPGNGLPNVELRVLKESLPKGISLSSFQDIGEQPPGVMKDHLKQGRAPLRRKIIAISYSESEELPGLGYLQQHLHEAMIYLLRPLVRLGADLMYAGWPPKQAQATNQNVGNMSLSLLNLHVDELANDNLRNPVLPRIFHPAAWPACDEISPADEAAWINHSSFEFIRPTADELSRAEANTAAHLALKAVSQMRMRKTMSKGYDCQVPRQGMRRVKPSAAVLVAGKIKNFHSLMPGLIEEFACHFENKRPIFLLGGFGGACGVIARALLNKEGAPAELTKEWLQTRRADYQDLVAGSKLLGLDENEQPEALIDWVLETINRARAMTLKEALRNGLSDSENVELLTTQDTSCAVYLVWQGLSRQFLSK